MCCQLGIATLVFPRTAGVWEGGRGHYRRVRQAEGLSSLYSYSVSSFSSHHTLKTTTTAWLEPTVTQFSQRGLSVGSPCSSLQLLMDFQIFPQALTFPATRIFQLAPYSPFTSPDPLLPITVLIVTLLMPGQFCAPESWQTQQTSNGFPMSTSLFPIKPSKNGQESTDPSPIGI